VREGVADRASAKRGSKNASGEGGGVNSETSRNKDAKAQDHDKGDGRRGGCSSLRVQGWWVVKMKFHGVEISIAGCVEKMVRD